MAETCKLSYCPLVEEKRIRLCAWYRGMQQKVWSRLANRAQPGPTRQDDSWLFNNIADCSIVSFASGFAVPYIPKTTVTVAPLC
jgi:hypothetical protein